MAMVAAAGTGQAAGSAQEVAMVVVVATGQAEATEPAGAMEKAAAVTSAVLLEPGAPAIEVEEEQAARVDSGSEAAAEAAA